MRHRPARREARHRGSPLFLCLVGLTLIVLAPSPAFAQSFGFLSGGSDPLAGTLAERDEVLERLDTAFVREQVARLDEVREGAGDELVPFDAEAPLGEARTTFVDEASLRLYELEGDGSLTLGEVAGAIPAIRDRHLRRFENVIEALSRGHEPPPVRGDFGGFWSYALAQTRYTLLTRTPPLAWALLLGCAATGVLIALALSRLLGSLAERFSRLEHRALGSAIHDIRVPLILASAACGLLVGIRFLWLPAAAESFATTALIIAVVGFAFLACWNLCDEFAGIVVRGVRRTTGHDSVEQVGQLIERALRVLVILAFLVIVARFVLGVSLTSMIAGLGIIGVGLWIITRGLVENVAASFTLFGDRLFRVGDTVIHEGEWGVIEDIGFRSTRCRTFEGHLLHIPNRNLMDDTIRNVSARPYLRSRFRLSLVYDTPPAKVEEAIGIVHAVIEAQGEAVNRAEGINVVFDAFGAHDLQILVQYYTASEDYWTAKGTMSAVNRELLRRFEEAGLAFAFPTQTTVLASDGEAVPTLRVEGELATKVEGEIASRDGRAGRSGVSGDDEADGERGGAGEDTGEGEGKGADGEGGGGARDETRRAQSGSRRRRAGVDEHEVDGQDDEDGGDGER